MKTKNIVLLAVLLALLSGCAAKKKITQKPAETKTEQISQAVEEEKIAPLPFIPGLAIAGQPTFSSAYTSKAKANIEYANAKITTNGSVTLLADSILIISVQPILGIELMRFEATKTDVVLLDKMNRRYVKMNYNELKAEMGLPITYNDLQAIAMDRLFVIGHDQSFILNQTDTVTVGNRTSLKIADGKLNYSYMIDNTSLCLQSTTIRMIGRKEEMKVSYSGHTPSMTGVLFPSTIELSYTGGAQEGKAIIMLQNVTFNAKVNAARVNLSAYNKTTLKTILSGK